MKLATFSSLLSLPLWLGVLSLTPMSPSFADAKSAKPASEKAAEAPATPASAPAASSTDPIPVDATKREDFEANVGKTVTVKGDVLRTKDWDGGSQKKKKMSFVDLKGGFFSTVTFEDDFPAFGKNLPGAAYKGKTIEVTGELQERQGHWQILLKSPDQVKVVEFDAKAGKKDAKNAKETSKDKDKDKDKEKTEEKDQASEKDAAPGAEDAESKDKKRVSGKKYFNK